MYMIEARLESRAPNQKPTPPMEKKKYSVSWRMINPPR